MARSKTRQAAELTIRAVGGEVRRACAWLESAALAQRIPRQQIMRLDHCLDEVLANVITHGGPAALASPVLVRLDVRRSRGACTAELCVADEGVAFDPSCSLLQPDAKPATLAEAMPGGLGLVMLRSFADNLTYRRSAGRNHLTITVIWTEAA